MIRLAAAVLMVCLPHTAIATSISITNVSFEDPVLEDGDRTAANVVPGWVVFNSLGCSKGEKSTASSPSKSIKQQVGVRSCFIEV